VFTSAGLGHRRDPFPGGATRYSPYRSSKSRHAAWALRLSCHGHAVRRSCRTNVATMCM